MNCPRCQTPTLVARNRGGMELDVCSTCSGIWLDRGELERLAFTPPAPATTTLTDHVDRDATGELGERKPDRTERGERPRQRDGRPDNKHEKQRKKQKSLGARVADALDDVFDDLFDDIFD
ncbi:MAG: zf-TFIIB domain-containing protein [Actinomycetota bacterium]